MQDGIPARNSTFVINLANQSLRSSLVSFGILLSCTLHPLLHSQHVKETRLIASRITIDVTPQRYYKFKYFNFERPKIETYFNSWDDSTVKHSRARQLETNNSKFWSVHWRPSRDKSLRHLRPFLALESQDP